MSRTEINTNDAIRINDLQVQVAIASGGLRSTGDGGDAEPLWVSIEVYQDITAAASSDDLSLSLDYAGLADLVKSELPPHASSLEDFLIKIVENTPFGGCQVSIKVAQLRAPSNCKSLGVEALIDTRPHKVREVKHFIKDFTLPVIVGVLPHERVERQNVIINIVIEGDGDGLEQQNWINLRQLTKSLYDQISPTSFQTLEALTSFVSQQILTNLTSGPTVHVRVAKPSALNFARSAEVSITRRLFHNPSQIKQTVAIALGSNVGHSFCSIEYALRLLEIPQGVLKERYAANIQDLTPILDVVNTSFMYRTAPMYFTNQPSFLNCACLVETNLPPVLLLRLLKEIETIVGRVPSVCNGPRAIDLDIVFYGNQIIDTRAEGQRSSLDNLEGELVVPHPRLEEREFVLRPLNDMIPDFVNPRTQTTLKVMLEGVINLNTSIKSKPMEKILPMPYGRTMAKWGGPTLPSIQPVPIFSLFTYSSPPKSPKRPHAPTPSISSPTFSNPKTLLMGTLNVTPDSFSDGGRHTAPIDALKYVMESIYSGSNMIDIGGYSTRPDAPFVSVQEEIGRVVPIIKAIRGLCEAVEEDEEGVYSGFAPKSESRQLEMGDVADTFISVDTFRWEVAEAALEAGANCINDVYGFTGPSYAGLDGVDGHPPEMYRAKLKEVARRYSAPVILMHSRGDAGQNKDYSAYGYTPDGLNVIEGIRIELGAKVDAVVKGKGGLRRWNIIVDPGIGFSKTMEGNLEVLREAAAVVKDVRVGDGMDRHNPLQGYPFLIGASRKSFLGDIIAQGADGRKTQPRERGWATAAAVSSAVQQGALFVRVHDVKEMRDVVRVSEKIWG